MKRSLTRAALRLNRLRLAGAIQVITCVIGVNAVSALGQHFNQIAADGIADCIGGQILQSMPLFASMSSGGTRCQFDCHPDSDGLPRQYASDDFSKYPFEAACETPFPVSVPGIAFE